MKSRPSKIICSQKALHAEATKSVISPFGFAKTGQISAKDFLDGLKLPNQVPKYIKKIEKIATELDFKISCFPINPLTTQWNTFFGASYFDTSTISIHPGLSSGAINNQMEARARGLYTLTHEVAHLLISEIYFRGLFNLVVNEKNCPPWAMHSISECFAGYISHYELGLATNDYWKDVWRPFIERSVGQVANIGLAAGRGGLRTKKERADFMLSTYGAARNYSKKRFAKLISPSFELLDVWNSERIYALKSNIASEYWWKNYWNSNQIKKFAKHFIPNEGSVIWLKNKKNPIRISSLEDLENIFPELIDQWKPAPAEIQRHLNVRRLIQRSALAVCQTQRLAEDKSILIAKRKRKQLIEILDKSFQVLVYHYEILDSQRGHISKKNSTRITVKINAIMKELTKDLISVNKGRLIFFIHPSVSDGGISDRGANGTGLSFKQFKQQPISSSEIQQRILIQEIELNLDLLIEDMLVVYEKSENKKNIKKAITQAINLKQGAELILKVSKVKSMVPFIRTVRKWFKKEKNNFILCYDLKWIIEKPFIDPLQKFRLT